MVSASARASRSSATAAGDERDEATFVANEIATLRTRAGRSPLDEIAVFYRTNAQSRAIEQALADRGSPTR